MSITGKDCQPSKSSLRTFWEDYATGISRSNSGIHFVGSRESYDKITEATKKALEKAESEESFEQRKSSLNMTDTNFTIRWNQVTV